MKKAINMDTLDVGDTLDIAVANAIGLEVLTLLGVERLLNRDDCEHLENVCVLTQMGLQRYQTPDHHGIWALKPWQPSRDIVVAMELFDKQSDWILTSMDIGHRVWVVYRDISELESGAAVGESTISAAHAIALAVVTANR
jgi:hypothetical protein